MNRLQLFGCGHLGCFVHGYCLALAGGEWNGEWERVVWGEPPLLMGRVPTALALALRFRGKCRSFRLAFGSGATWRDGLSEARYTIAFAQRRLASLHRFAAFAHVDSEATSYLGSLLAGATHDSESSNTQAELRSAARIFNGHDLLFLVSSPGHVPRVASLASVAAAHGTFGGTQVMFAASHTSYHGGDGSETLIQEAPHQPWLLWRRPLVEILRRLVASHDAGLVALARAVSGDEHLGPPAVGQSCVGHSKVIEAENLCLF